FSRRGFGAEPGLEGHRAGPHRPDRGHLVRRQQPGAVDGPLPHRRTHAERHDVQLQRRPRSGDGRMTAPHGEAQKDPASDQVLDVVVVGGSQSGLAMAWHLLRQGLRFVVLEAGPVVGHVWRSRWDSLKLFTPAQYDALPGMAFPAPADTYPTKDPVADYLQVYAKAFDLPVRLNAKVTELRRLEDGSFEVHTAEAATGLGRWWWLPGRSRFPSARRRPVDSTRRGPAPQRRRPQP